jgi:hypothetical protein
MAETATTARIVHALGGAESPFRDELVRMAVDHVLAQRLRDFVDFDAARDIVVKALGAENLGRILARHAAPGFHRYTLHVERSDETLGALVPDVARARIRRIIDESRLPRAKWAKDSVDPSLVRKLFAPVWTNVLVSFAKRLPIPGAAPTGGGGTGVSGLGAGLAGRLTRTVQEHAERIAEKGRSAMGGIGAEVEKRVQAAAREFSESAASVFREALEARLSSKEGRQIIGELSRQMFEHLMTTRLAELHEDPSRANVPEILQASAEVVGHSVTQPFVTAVIEREVAEFVALEGERPLAEVLDELGVLAEVRAVAVDRVGDVARGLFGTPAFADWLARLLGT